MTIGNKFKNAVRHIVRRATNVPYVGRAARVAVAVWRTPEMRRQLIDNTERLTELSEKVHGHENLAQSAPVALRSLAQELNNIEHRLEFVRRELMFEMRHGAGSKQSAKPNNRALDDQPRIVSKEKLEAARDNTLRLNLGCGHIPLDEYINIDRRELLNVDIIADVNELPFEKGEVDEIFSSHVLEHFPEEKLRRELLPYWKSLLKPNGVFRAIVPDSEFMIREYCNNNYSYADLREVIFGSQDYDGDFHFNMFVPDQLSNLLTEAGFADVQIEVRGRRNGICFEMAVIARNKTS